MFIYKYVHTCNMCIPSLRNYHQQYTYFMKHIFQNGINTPEICHLLNPPPPPSQFGYNPLLNR